MATKHQLTLKAVLDTSQVKNELNKLRQNQQNATKGGTSAGFNGNISSVLRNLNTTLQSLQRSIDKLSGFEKQRVKSQMHQNSPGNSPGIIPYTLRSGKTAKSSVGQAQKDLFDKLQSKAITRSRNIFIDPDISKGLHELRRMTSIRNKGFIPEGAAQYWSDYNSLAKSNNWMYKAAGEAFLRDNPDKTQFIRKSRINKLNSMLEYYGVGSAVAKPPRQRISPMTHMGMRLGAGIVMGGLSEYAAATGNEGMSKGLSFGSNVATYAGMGMMFGPQGAALGAIFGAAKSGLDMLTESAKNAASALDQQASRVSGAAGTDKSVYEFFRGLNDEKALKDKDVGYFKQQLESANTRYDVAQKYLKGSGIGIEEGALEAYEKQTLNMELIKQGKFKPKTVDDMKLLKRYGGMSEEKLASTIKIRNETADEYKRIAADISGYKGRVDEVRKIIEELEKPDTSKDKARNESITSKQKARQESITSRIETIQDKLSSMQTPGLENVNSLAAQGFMISQSDDEARLEESNSYLRDIASITREIKNLEKEKETSTYL